MFGKYIIIKIFGRMPKRGFFKPFYIGGVIFYFFQVFSGIYFIAKKIISSSYGDIFHDIIGLLLFIVVVPLMIRGILNLTHFKYYDE